MPDEKGTPPPETADGLWFLILKRVEATYSDTVELITTDRTGVVDGAWRLADGGLKRVELWRGYERMSRAARKYGLYSLGELVRLYVAHPDADPDMIRARYEQWPLMVELELPDC